MLIEMLIENTSSAYIAACQLRSRIFASGLKMVMVDRCRCDFNMLESNPQAGLYPVVGMHWVGPNSQPPPPPPFSDSFIREVRFSEWEKPGLEVNIGHGTFPVY